MKEWKQAQIYIKNEDSAVWESFKKICAANGWKHSEKIMSFVRETVAVHSGGGSQTLLENSGLPLTMPRWKTCKHSDKRLSKGEFMCQSPRNNQRFIKTPNRCDDCKLYKLEDVLKNE